MRNSQKILHIAVINAGFPSDFCKMHIQNGDYSRLVTFYKNKMGFPEDICMNYFFPKGKLVSRWRKKKQNDLSKELSIVENDLQKNKKKAHYFKAKNIAEKIYFNITDRIRKPFVEKTIKNNNLDDFDIIHYDFGLDFYRSPIQAKKWKQMGKKIVLCYYGSDLRIRGVIKELEELSDLSITGEYDHLLLKPDLEYLFFPYDTSELPEKQNNETGRIRIVHSPTNRQFKGTDKIIEVMEKIKKERDIEFILLENRERSEVLQIKSACDIGIECVCGTMGGYGYGKSGLEMLGMGLPVITSMPQDYADWLPENPFITANNDKELYNKLISLIDNPEILAHQGLKGKQWVDKYHGFEAVNRRLYDLYKKYGIID